MPFLLCGALVVMLGFAAFAIDVGRAYFAKRQLQASADAAALAGAQNLPDEAAAKALADAVRSEREERARRTWTTCR